MKKSILLSQWILPVCKPPIQDGAIVLENGKISDVGEAKKILKENPKLEVEDLGPSILLPGLVNAHTHLEYSCLYEQIKPQKNFSGWLLEIIQLKKNISKNQIVLGIQKHIISLKKLGIILVGEVTNTGLAAPLLEEQKLSGNIYYELVGDCSFQEYLNTEKKLKEEAPSFHISPACHAPHTVPLDILKKVKAYIHQKRLYTSIHLSESMDENKWIQKLNGSFSDLIQTKALLQNPFFGKGLSPTQYLYKNNFLSPKVLCVHCAHPLPQDFSLLKKTGSYIALCPRSNQYTGTGLPPIKKLLKYKILLCLGTDSLASNDDLDLWNEMRFFKKHFPFLTLPFILRMATLHGAHALGFGNEYGSIEKGKKAKLIFIKTGKKQVQDPYQFLMAEKHEIFHYNSHALRSINSI